MPAVVGRRPLAPAARLRFEVAPLLVVVLLSFLFALAVWSALAPRPMLELPTVALQGGL